MSENHNTEALEKEDKTIVKIAISEMEAEGILQSIGAPFPPAKGLSEIHLIIKKEK